MRFRIFSTNLSFRFRTQVGFFYGLALHDRPWRPLGDFPAEIQHHHTLSAMRNSSRRRCSIMTMVFPSTRSFSMIGRMESHFRHAEAGKEFIEDDEIRTHGQALTQFEAFQIAVGAAPWRLCRSRPNPARIRLPRGCLWQRRPDPRICRRPSVSPSGNREAQ